MPQLSPVRDDRSPKDVLVVLLLAAFVIVVTSLLVTVVFDLGQESAGGDLAGAAMQFASSEDVIRVTFTSMERPDTTLEITVRNVSSGERVRFASLDRVGENYVFADLTPGTSYEVVVVAAWHDRRSVVIISEGRL